MVCVGVGVWVWWGVKLGWKKKEGQRKCQVQTKHVGLL